ncbi:DUF4360 domain-containing protein [Oligoflexus tunisiensis]|uniref:DUF4360 domain-containing protein n=1 Tax=Oligoflexus tunisiensis TaxID=708132 RepID=UPI00114D25AC|nr:DUF4360 domain-containing protein [Oligoflexus tunisiensis]
MRKLLWMTFVLLWPWASVQAQILVTSFHASGNGCPPGSTDHILSSDQQTLQILFSQFIAELPGESTKSCNVQLQLEVPQGLALSWYRTEHRGFIDTSGGADAEFIGRYHAQGAGLDFENTQSWPAQTVGDYLVTSQSPGHKWTKCGGKQKLTMRTMIRLKGQPVGFNTLTVDDKTFRAESRLFFTTKRC